MLSWRTPRFECKILRNAKQSAQPTPTPFPGRSAPLQAELTISSSPKTKTLAITTARQRGRAVPLEGAVGFSGVTQAEGTQCGAAAKQPNTTMTDGEANHSITERPFPFQADFHPGMSPLTLVQPHAAQWFPCRRQTHRTCSVCLCLLGTQPCPGPFERCCWRRAARTLLPGPWEGALTHLCSTLISSVWVKVLRICGEG